MKLTGGEEFSMKISEAFSLFEKSEIICGGLSSKTAESYRNCEKLVVGYFGDISIRELRAEDVQSFFEHLSSWQRPDTVRGNIIELRSVIRRIRREEPEILDPDLIKVPKREKREVEYLTAPEVLEFIDVVGEKRRGYAEINRLRNITIVELLFSSGVRVGELCRLNRNSIREGQFTVVGKSKSPRVCFVNGRAQIAIKTYLDRRTDKNPALFISNQSEERITPGGVREVFKNACARSEFEGVHPHTIRHSFATFMLEKEVDLRYIADLMGHESLDTTKIYTHYANPKLKRIYQGAMANFG